MISCITSLKFVTYGLLLLQFYTVPQSQVYAESIRRSFLDTLISQFKIDPQGTEGEIKKLNSDIEAYRKNPKSVNDPQLRKQLLKQIFLSHSEIQKSEVDYLVIEYLNSQTLESFAEDEKTQQMILDYKFNQNPEATKVLVERLKSMDIEVPEITEIRLDTSDLCGDWMDPPVVQLKKAVNELSWTYRSFEPFEHIEILMPPINFLHVLYGPMYDKHAFNVDPQYMYEAKTHRGIIDLKSLVKDYGALKLRLYFVAKDSSGTSFIKCFGFKIMP